MTIVYSDGLTLCGRLTVGTSEHLSIVNQAIPGWSRSDGTRYGPTNLTNSSAWSFPSVSAARKRTAAAMKKWGSCRFTAPATKTLTAQKFKGSTLETTAPMTSVVELAATARYRGTKTGYAAVARVAVVDRFLVSCLAFGITLKEVREATAGCMTRAVASIGLPVPVRQNDGRAMLTPVAATTAAGRVAISSRRQVAASMDFTGCLREKRATTTRTPDSITLGYVRASRPEDPDAFLGVFPSADEAAATAMAAPFVTEARACSGTVKSPITGYSPTKITKTGSLGLGDESAYSMSKENYTGTPVHRAAGLVRIDNVVIFVKTSDSSPSRALTRAKALASAYLTEVGVP